MSRSPVIALLLVWVGVSQASAESWSDKMFKTKSHNFGAVARWSKAEFEFEFQNIYEEDIHVASVRSSCGCTTPTVTKSTLKTWEKAAVVAKYNTRSFLGYKSATVTVVIDRPYYAEVQLRVQGYIRSDVVFAPGEVNFGEIDQFNGAENKVKVDYAGRSSWRIVDVRSANPHIEVELTETKRYGGRVGYEMLVRLKPDTPAGYFQDQLTIVSDDDQRQTVPLVVHGRIVSPLTVSPASLFLGVLEPGQSITKQLVVRGKQPFKVLKINCCDDCFEFEEPADAKKTLHLIPVTFTAGEGPVKVAEKIEIETDLGSGAVTTCLATGTVRGSEGAE